MTTATMTLVDFLEARLAEDKAWAREYRDAGVYGIGVAKDGGSFRLPVLCDPARVLREVEAKRRIIEAAWADHVRIEGEWESCQSQEQMAAKDDVPDTLRALASVYDSHPDFREEWRP
jgi:hypothetical protein